MIVIGNASAGLATFAGSRFSTGESAQQPLYFKWFTNSLST